MRGGLVFHLRRSTPHEISGRKKRSDEGEELNGVVSLVVAKSMKMTKKSKSKDTSDSENETETEHFNFKHIKIVTCEDTE